MTAETKVCAKCHLEQPITSFVVTDKAKGYRKGACRKCDAKRVREYYHANPKYRAKQLASSTARTKANPRTAEETRRILLRYKYGLTEEQFDQLMVMQGGKCALCGAIEHGRKPRKGSDGRKWLEESWPVDHCHKEGRVRGLLCHSCNTQLGGYEALLEKVGEAKLLDYLTRPSPVLALPVAPVPEPPPAPRFVADLPPRYTRGQCSVCGEDQHAGNLCFKHYTRARRRGGDVGPAENLPRGTLKGATHYKVTLTESQAREIKFSTEKGADLARRFNVKPSVVSSIRHGHTWKHLSAETLQ